MCNTTPTPSDAPLDLEVLYGQTPTPKETPSLIKESMKEFREDLEKDQCKTSNWRLAEERCPDECRDEFKLVFLRCEVFRVKLAVKRYIKYWNKRVDIFGPERAFLPIMDLGPNGAMKDNKIELEFGTVRSSIAEKCTDPDGRVILFLDGERLDAACKNPHVTSEGLVREWWYQMHVALQAESAQRKGVVAINSRIRSISTLVKSPARVAAASIRGALPIRLAGLHLIDPPALFSVMMKITKGLIGETLYKRISVHSTGSVEKNLESLSKFGIGKEQFPKELGGACEFQDIQSKAVG